MHIFVFTGISDSNSMTHSNETIPKNKLELDKWMRMSEEAKK